MREKIDAAVLQVSNPTLSGSQLKSISFQVNIDCGVNNILKEKEKSRELNGKKTRDH